MSDIYTVKAQKTIVMEYTMDIAAESEEQAAEFMLDTMKFLTSTNEQSVDLKIISNEKRQ